MANALSSFGNLGVTPDYERKAPSPTNPAPAPMAPGNALKPMATPQMSPYAAPKKPMQNALLGSAVDGFMRGFAPQQREADIARRKGEGMDKMKQTLALIEQQRALPMEQRAQWWQQNADGIGQIIGQDVRSMPVDPNQFTDEALDGHRAMLSAQLGIAPEAAEYMNLGGGTVGKTQGGKFSIAHEGPTEPVKPTIVNNRVIDPNDPTKVIADYSDPTKPADLPEGMWYGQDGKGPPQPIPGYVDMRARIAAAGRAPGGSDELSFRTLTPEELAQRGYPKGSVVQVDSRGKEYRTASPSTAQTGQPTESERAAGLHAQVSLNGLRQLMAMEGEGYNRAGVVEQMFGGTFGLEKERLYDQAADEFIDGYLRAMTGAAATKQEIDNYKQQWFPKWGDTPAVIAQKSAGRMNAIQAMKSKAGRSWNPSWDALLNGMQGQGAGPMSASPMQLATEQGAETVPGMNWNAAQMNYQSAPAGDLSSYSTEDLQRMLAEAEGQ